MRAERSLRLAQLVTLERAELLAVAVEKGDGEHPAARRGGRDGLAVLIPQRKIWCRHRPGWNDDVRREARRGCRAGRGRPPAEQLSLGDQSQQDKGGEQRQ